MKEFQYIYIKNVRNLGKYKAVLVVAKLDHKHLSWYIADPKTRVYLQRK